MRRNSSWRGASQAKRRLRTRPATAARDRPRRPRGCAPVRHRTRWRASVKKLRRSASLMPRHTASSSRAKAAPDASPLVESRSRHRSAALGRRRPESRPRTSSRPASAIDVQSWSSMLARIRDFPGWSQAIDSSAQTVVDRILATPALFNRGKVDAGGEACELAAPARRRSVRCFLRSPHSGRKSPGGSDVPSAHHRSRAARGGHAGRRLRPHAQRSSERDRRGLCRADRRSDRCDR